eukprot:SAG31_NODE_793_length_12044_cov_12.886229_2_plen_46_part_00
MGRVNNPPLNKYLLVGTIYKYFNKGLESSAVLKFKFSIWIHGPTC